MIITIIVMIIIIIVSLTIINLHPKLYLETLKFLKDEHFLASKALYPSDHFPPINVVDIFFEVT